MFETTPGRCIESCIPHITLMSLIPFIRPRGAMERVATKGGHIWVNFEKVDNKGYSASSSRASSPGLRNEKSELWVRQDTLPDRSSVTDHSKYASTYKSSSSVSQSYSQPPSSPRGTVQVNMSPQQRRASASYAASPVNHRAPEAYVDANTYKPTHKVQAAPPARSSSPGQVLPSSFLYLSYSPSLCTNANYC